MPNRKAKAAANRLAETFDVEPGPSEWKRIQLGRSDSAVIGCPRCGAVTDLHDSHIAPDGAVSPAFECRQFACGLSLHIVLEGWAADKATETHS